MRKSKFALYFGNRGFFPEKLISSARKDMTDVLNELGHETLLLDDKATKYGAIESPADGAIFAEFLKVNRGNYDGIILCLPNFGDETGAISALQNADVPILIQAYPDEINKMGFADRRDAFCGKFSVMDVFTQYGLSFSSFTPHVVHPKSKKFAEHVKKFDAICRIVNGMKHMTVGAIGARTTAFKTVRYDELTLQKYGITNEVLDLSEIIDRVHNFDVLKKSYKSKQEKLKNYTNWNNVPNEAFNNLSKLGVVIDEIIEEYKMDAIALRCWLELEKQLKVSPCVLLSELNDRNIPAACELDVCNAVAMYALNLASGKPATCLDWNNNWGNDENKCILFHCGPVPQKMMTAKGHIIDHPMFAKALGAGCGYGCNIGRIAPTPMTFASSVTQNGKLEFFIDEGEFTEDVIPEEFFGCAGVAKIDDLQNKLQKIGFGGYRHHVSVTSSHVGEAVKEAFEKYLNYDIMEF